jgi:two-component system, OmpR family, sensor histidine kinase VicK
LAISSDSSPAKSNRTEEKEELTKVLDGMDTVMNTFLQFLNAANNTIDACVDYSRPSLAIDIPVIKHAFLNAKKRGTRLRYLTEITNDNISFCKQLLTMVDEIRHLDGIQGNFYISETTYIAPSILHKDRKPAEQIIYSNVKQLVEHQSYVFENFWNRAIPAGQKIREIEEGLDLGKMEVIQSSRKILEMFINMIKSANHEILLILPTTNAFLREERIGAIELLKQSAMEHNVSVRIITPTNDAIEKILQDVPIPIKKEHENNKQENKSFEVQRSDIELKEVTVTTVTILVVDRKASLVIEKTDDSKEDFIEAIGLSSYSNSKPTVMSYISIFEGLWIQTQLYEQLKDHDLAQKEFINIAAHELRTPIQSIMGYSELMECEPERSEFLTPIVRNAYRLQKLSNDILDVTRIESNRLKLDIERVNLSHLLSEIVRDFKDNISTSTTDKPDDVRTQNVLITCECQHDILIDADKTRITQVISNLLENASKFTKKGLIAITCSVEKENEDNNGHCPSVITSIKDTGDGISADILPRLFSKFVTNSISGTGLGLFLSKSIIEAHKGRIWAQNNPDGSGATFSFSLPSKIGHKP